MEDIKSMSDAVLNAHNQLHEATGQGNEYLGWLDYPKNHDKDEYARIKSCASKIQENSDVLLVCGIGGSYLGARAAIEALTHSFYNSLDKNKRGTPEIYFVGNSISPSYFNHLLQVIDGKEVSINIISKSGTTTEPALAFRLLRKMMSDKYGEKASERIYATTDKAKGALNELAKQEGYEMFIIPDNVGGRFSIFTPVGLLPIAVAGIDIDQMMSGAVAGMEEYQETSLEDNPCYQYAVVRNLLYNRGKKIEVLANYEPSIQYVSEWWKQLYGESEGKDGKGLFPASVNFSADLHSMGQYIQDGERHLFETVLSIDQADHDLTMVDEKLNLDNLNYLSGKTMSYINRKAFEGTILAHVDGGVPNVVINVPKMDAFYFGKLLYFFMKACGISGYILDVNPFNQPGVEDYKRNMFALLGKPGFEDLREELIKKL